MGNLLYVILDPIKREGKSKEAIGTRSGVTPSSEYTPFFMEGKMKVLELARVCGLSKPSVYKYLKMMG